ncbi:recombinase family protein [Actinomadura parmotrematis]|uniref:Recombinase family protein n=1 Tax=Actinomadura parmotrematis TaxID=2864039 RepID=A0ABS7FNY1_9ACTN|nr:recombinase family protein [Actinomadura parmotrematis]MBW8482083.1 recombinase family protein [Actinomadura parmotrematis]
MPDLALAVAYARKSHKGQAPRGRGEISTHDQHREMREGACALGIEIAETHSDSESAWTDKAHAGWDATLAAIDSGEYHVLILHAIDRMSRLGGYSRFAEDIKRRVARGELRVIGLLDDYDSALYRDPETAAHELDKHLIAARRYSDKLSKRIRASKTRHRLGGGHVGKPAYGWRIADPENRKIERDPDEWPIVERIFTEVAAGQKGLMAVARALNAEGARTRRDAEWSSRTLHGMINNPVYEGFLSTTDVAGGVHRYLDGEGNPVNILAPGASPMPPALVREARAALTGRAHHGSRRAAKQGVANTDLCGLLKCPGCAGPMVSGGLRYRCAKTARGGTCPQPSNIVRHRIESLAWEIAAQIVTRLDPRNPDDRPTLAAIAEAWSARERPGKAEESAAARNAVNAAQKTLDRVTRNARLGVYDNDDKGLARDLQETRLALRVAQERLGEVEDEIALALPWAGADLAAPELVEAWASEPGPRRRAILGSVLAEVRVARAPAGTRRFDASRVSYRVQGGDAWVTCPSGVRSDRRAGRDRSDQAMEVPPGTHGSDGRHSWS